MDQNEKNLKQWVSCWVKAAPLLEKLRYREIRDTDTAKGIGILNDAFESAMLNSPPRLTSGLVSQQLYFKKAAK